MIFEKYYGENIIILQEKDDSKKIEKIEKILRKNNVKGRVLLALPSNKFIYVDFCNEINICSFTMVKKINFTLENFIQEARILNEKRKSL